MLQLMFFHSIARHLQEIHFFLLILPQMHFWRKFGLGSKVLRKNLFRCFISTACCLRTCFHPLKKLCRKIPSEGGVASILIFLLVLFDLYPKLTLFFTPNDHESLSNGRVSLTIQPGKNNFCLFVHHFIILYLLFITNKT